MDSCNKVTTTEQHVALKWQWAYYYDGSMNGWMDGRPFNGGSENNNSLSISCAPQTMRQSWLIIHSSCLLGRALGFRPQPIEFVSWMHVQKANPFHLS